jgi:hypothetical protein
MIEFFQSYGLWIVLGAVFLLMNLFGMGCCGGRHRHESSKRSQVDQDQNPRAGQTSEAAPRPNSSYH